CKLCTSDAVSRASRDRKQAAGRRSRTAGRRTRNFAPPSPVVLAGARKRSRHSACPSLSQPPTPIMRNLKLAFRTLLKSPFVTAVAVLSLALGIGANAAIFSLFDQLLLRPLPVVHPERLVDLAAHGPMPGSQSCNQAGDCEEVFSYPMFRDLENAHV